MNRLKTHITSLRFFLMLLGSLIAFPIWAGSWPLEEDPQTIEDFYRLRNGVIKYQQLDLDTSTIYVDSCLEVSKKLNNKFFLGKAYHLKSQILILNSDIDSAMQYMTWSTEIMRHYPDSLDHFVMEYNLGNMYLYNDDKIKALIQYKKVLTIIDENFDVYAAQDIDKVNLNRAYTFVSVGMVYGKLGDHLRAMDNLRKGMRVAFRIKTKESEILRAITLGNIGLTYYELGDYKNAEIYTISGLDLKLKLGLKSLMGYNYQILAKNAFGMGKYDLSLRYLKISDKVFANFKNYNEMDRNQFWYAKCYYAKEDYNQSIEKIQPLIVIYENNFAKSELADLYELYGECLKAKGELKGAYTQFRVANLLKQELNKTNKSRMISQYLEFFKEEELQIKRRLLDVINRNESEQLELKLKQESTNRVNGYLTFGLISLVILSIIFVLWNANKRKKRINEDLVNSIEDKQLLFKEVHHRVKNNFQVISSLLNLQQGNSQNIAEQKTLSDAQIRIQSMALVHELLYKRNEVKTLDFKEYLEELIKTLFDSFVKEDGNITYSVNCKETRLDLDVAIPLGLLVNEIVTNSLKYAFSELNIGHISIDLEEYAAGEYLLKVKDNGKGIPREVLEGNSNTLGIELIRILSEQLHGKVEFINENGTTVKLYFSRVL